MVVSLIPWDNTNIDEDFRNSYNKNMEIIMTELNGIGDISDNIKELNQDVQETNDKIIQSKGLLNNQGVEYPLLNLIRDGLVNPVEDIVKSTILSASVHGAKRDRYYVIEWIGNGYTTGGKSYWGMQLAEFRRDETGKIDSSTRRQLLSYRDDNFPEPTTTIVSRTIDLPVEGLIFEVSYDRSSFTSTALNISNGPTGRALGCVIHHENYYYRLTSTVVGTNKILVDKLQNEFTVYRLASNGNYVGINMLFAEKALDTSVLSSNYKLWSVKYVKEFKRTENTFVPVRTIIDNPATTMDTILREKQTKDYTGGLYHGDEVNEEVILTIDGKVIPANTVGVFEANELRIMQRNKLYRDNQYTNGELQQFGTVGKEHVFNAEDGYVLPQVITFHEPVTLTFAIMGALPLYRVDDKGNPLWNTFYNDIAYLSYNIATAGESTPEEENVQTAVFIGNKVSCVYKEERTNPLPGNRTWINNVGSYAKLYNSFCPSGYVTKADEQFKQTTKYYFDFN